MLKGWRFQRLAPAPRLSEPSLREWWRPALGALGICLLAVPYYLVIDFGTSAAFQTATPAQGRHSSPH